MDEDLRSETSACENVRLGESDSSVTSIFKLANVTQRHGTNG